MASIKQLERRVERLRAKLDDARATGREIRRAKGPWAATNVKANRRVQARLQRELGEAGNALFKARLAAEAKEKAT